MGDSRGWQSGAGQMQDLRGDFIMNRIIFTYGSLAGVVLLINFAIAFSVGLDGGIAGMVAGYLSMLVALSLVFVGVRRYRDQMLGGVIRFLPAFGVGMGIGLVATGFYVIGWEAYMFSTDYGFMADYTAKAIASKKAAGAGAAELAAFSKEMADFAVSYSNPLYRIPITFSEIAPIVLLAALVSAGILRNPRALPAKV
jgi:Protein of unknown function (DUF4199)